jgi:hypothetical protein
MSSDLYNQTFTEIALLAKGIVKNAKSTNESIEFKGTLPLENQ